MIVATLLLAWRDHGSRLLPLREGLERQAPDLGGLNIPITIVQGTSDTLVPPENVDYLRSFRQPTISTVMTEDADHFLPWTHPQLLSSALDCLMREVGGHASSDSVSDR